ANLAVSYSTLRKYEQAMQLQEDVVELCTQILGELHPDTLASLYSLAVYQGKLGQDTQA
ncbi:hypothetical protein CPB86DRAFT_668083, partial [Serendipita vermifera]